MFSSNPDGFGEVVSKLPERCDSNHESFETFVSNEHGSRKNDDLNNSKHGPSESLSESIRLHR